MATYQLLVSDDAGATWTEIHGRPGVYNPTGGVISTASLAGPALITVGQSVDSGIVAQRSDDDGRTWRTIPTASCAGSIGLHVAPPERAWIAGDLYTCDDGSHDGATRIARSTDGGLTWSRTDTSTRQQKPR